MENMGQYAKGTLSLRFSPVERNLKYKSHRINDCLLSPSLHFFQLLPEKIFFWRTQAMENFSKYPKGARPKIKLVLGGKLPLGFLLPFEI